jgi:hypothetical protein
MYSGIKILILMVILILGSQQLSAQQTKQQQADTVKMVTQADTTRKSTGMDDEIELMEINIEAVIEKPSVAILPKRIEPELGEAEFINRSFEKELKQAPDKLMIMDNRLFVPKKIEDLKEKLINRKKSLK